VRDLAEAHIRAFEREQAGGERIIVSAGTSPKISLNDMSLTIELIGQFVWNDWSEFL
jgi:nucleoside-diphosphate-sugar epimerase